MNSVCRLMWWLLVSMVVLSCGVLLFSFMICVCLIVMLCCCNWVVLFLFSVMLCVNKVIWFYLVSSLVIVLDIGCLFSRLIVLLLIL